MTGSGGNAAWSAMETDYGSKWRQGPNAAKRWCDILQLIKLVSLTATTYSPGMSLAHAAKAADVARAASVWAGLQTSMKTELGSLSKVLKLLRKWPSTPGGQMSAWLSTGSWNNPPAMLPSAWAQQQLAQQQQQQQVEQVEPQQHQQQQAEPQQGQEEQQHSHLLAAAGASDQPAAAAEPRGSNMQQPSFWASSAQLPQSSKGDGGACLLQSPEGGRAAFGLPPERPPVGGASMLQPGGPQLQPHVVGLGGATLLQPSSGGELPQPSDRADNGCAPRPPPAYKSHKAKRPGDSGKPQRVPHAYMRFCQSIKLPKGTPGQAAIKGKMWKDLSDAQRKSWAPIEGTVVVDG
jgi:hypothetical protein